MLVVAATSILICAGALATGQVALRLAGVRQWNWLAPAVGLSVQMLVCVPALHLPGRALTTFVLLLAVTLGSLALVLRDTSLRPPVTGLLAGLPSALLGCVPFASAGAVGTLGVNFNNDMASHLGWAEAYRSADIAEMITIHDAYPLGPHAVVAALAKGLSMGVEDAFSALTLSAVVCIGWTALGALRRVGAFGQVVTASLVGMPFLVAGYYGQGSFKELQEALFVLAAALMLMRWRELSGRLRWLPLGLLLAGTISVYSFPGLVWPLGLLGVWLAGLAAADIYRHRSVKRLFLAGRSELGAIAIAAGITLVALVPQLPRLYRFFVNNADVNGTGIEEDNLGNLVGRIEPWTALGMWDNADYRLPPIDAFDTGMWTAFALALVVYGAVWWFRRGDWVVPAAALVGYVIWRASDRTQSPYVAAKALVILTPLLYVIAVRALVEPDPARPRQLALGAPILIAALAYNSLGVSWDVLRYSNVGPDAHLEEIRSLKPDLDGHPTIYLGNSDFTRWEFAGVPVRAPVIANQDLGMRPEKEWVYGQPFDFDSLDAAAYNAADFVVAPRNSYSSAAPSELRLVRQTRSFSLYRRGGEVPQRTLLAEKSDPGATLDCRSKEGRQMSRAGGVAAIRPQSVLADVPPAAPGQRVSIALDLPPGTWELDTPYQSDMPVDVTIPGHASFELPANLDRPGPRFRIGGVQLDRAARLRVEFRPEKNRFTSPANVAVFNNLAATSAGGVREIPVREACGRVVDYILPTASP